MEKITVTLTHYKRLNHLDRTINSFLETNNYPIDQFLIIDDSGDPHYSTTIKEKYSKLATIIVNENTIGQRKSIDRLFNLCKNEYIFHLEDDWLFDCPKDSKYIEDSLTILKNREDIHQIWIRHDDDNPHKCVGDILEVNNVQFKIVDPNFRGMWNGFSWNPGLRRKSDLKRFFPNGVQEFKNELEAAKHTRHYNFTVAKLENTACRHIGGDCPTQNNEFNF